METCTYSVLISLNLNSQVWPVATESQGGLSASGEKVREKVLSQYHPSLLSCVSARTRNGGLQTGL